MVGAWAGLDTRPAGPAQQATDRIAAAARPLSWPDEQPSGRLYVSPKTVSRWAKEGKLPFMKTLGGHRRYPAVKIRELAEELREEPTT